MQIQNPNLKTPSDQEVIELTREILSSGYQKELPATTKPVLDIPSEISTTLPGIFSTLGLGILVILFVILVFFVFNNNVARRDENPADLNGASNDVDFSSLAIADPAELAKQGNFTGAIHALLLRSLVLTGNHIDSSWPRSLTSREILRHEKLPADAQQDLGQLISRVEVYHFGGLNPGENDYHSCQEIYDHLACGLRGTNQ
ncbi:MAG: hypothetical protein GY780_05830 [bacterium]|nr:hypothetical protein [bacterium]